MQTFENATKFPPLPEGEGRGEGEGDVIISHVSKILRDQGFSNSVSTWRSILFVALALLSGCVTPSMQTKSPASPMKPRISVITLGVADLTRAYHFYKDGLGFPTKMTPDG